jgi:hypothetical protein
MSGTGSGLGPHFRLNLTNISKTATPPIPEISADPPADPPSQPPSRIGRSLLKPEAAKAATVQGVRSPDVPSRVSTTLARKNLVLGSDSASDDDLGLELIPVGEDDPSEKANTVPDVIEAPAVAISHLPDLIDRDDEDDSPEAGQSNKFSLLQEMLLPQELADERNDIWSYRSFIKQFAQSEASTEAPEGENQDDAYSAEDEESNEYD